MRLKMVGEYCCQSYKTPQRTGFNKGETYIVSSHSNFVLPSQEERKKEAFVGAKKNSKRPSSKNW